MLIASARYDPRDFWEPLDARRGRVVLDPGQFYIFASKENVLIPPDEAAEMAPIRPELGEFRAHYAGFFDPGFGMAPNEGRAVLEVRSRDVPFFVEDGQPVGKLGVRAACRARWSGSTAKRARTIRARASSSQSTSRPGAEWP